MNSITPKITWLGVGPGDPELITLKGIRTLQTADCIAYDKCINPHILEYASANCFKYKIEKNEHGCDYLPLQLNVKIVALAKQYGHLIWLKAGDPIVFENTYDEVHFAESYGVSTQIIPGIIKGYGVAVNENIPLPTQEGVWFINGNLEYDIFMDEINLSAQSRATTIISGGIRRIKQILNTYISFGKANRTIVVIQQLPDNKVEHTVGKIKTILKIIQEKEITDPVTIIISEDGTI
jgi:uroporphyrin-III C-methyltransferase